MAPGMLAPCYCSPALSPSSTSGLASCCCASWDPTSQGQGSESLSPMSEACTGVLDLTRMAQGWFLASAWPGLSCHEHLGTKDFSLNLFQINEN